MMTGFYGIFPILGVLGLLTISFFILLTVPKADSKNVRQLGKGIVVAIWITALYLSGVSIYSNFKGEACPYKYGKMKMKKMYKHRGERMR